MQAGCVVFFVPGVIQQELSNPPAGRDLRCLHVSLSARNLFSSEDLLTFCLLLCIQIHSKSFCNREDVLFFPTLPVCIICNSLYVF